MTKLRIFIMITTILVVSIVGTALIYYARGYRFDQDNLNIAAEGLLVANSDPNGAQVFVDGELETATNNTISLALGTHDIVIKKEGFRPWEKRITIAKDEVTQVDAFLISIAPNLTALTFSGAYNPQISPENTKIAYAVLPDGDNGEKAGLWVFETTNLPLGFNRDPKQVTDGDLTEATWEWSPDARDLLLTTNKGVFLLQASAYTPQAQRTNVASQLKTIKKEWEDKRQKLLTTQLGKLHQEIREILEVNATDIHFSPDEDRILYTASTSATIPEDIVQELPGASTQKQERDIKVGKSYVYDIKEDRNFNVADEDKKVYWLPNSINVIIPEEDKIIVKDYDGTNSLDLYSGQYTAPYAFPSSSSGRILILTNLGQKEASANLYWLSLK